MKKKFLTMLGIVLVLALALCVFAACNNDDEVKVDTHKVTFVDGDRIVSIVNVEVNKPMTIKDIPAAPQHDGELFDGWFYEGAAVGDGFVPAGDITVTAVYHTPVAGEYIASFSLGRYPGSGKAPANMGATTGNTITLPAVGVNWEGFVFVGWEVDGTIFPAGAKYSITGNVQFVASWTANGSVSYTLHFETNGGSSVSDIVAKPGTVLAATVDPTKANRTFAGWYDNAAFEGNPLQIPQAMPDHNATYYAKWVLRYTLNIKQQNVTLDGYDLVDSFVRDIPDAQADQDVDEYMAITGFKLVDGETEFRPVNGEVYELVYDRQQYTVTYQVNNEVDEEADFEDVAYYGVEYAVKDFYDMFEGVRGYRFLNWQEGTTPVESATLDVIANTTLSATWDIGYHDMGGGEDFIYIYADGSIHLDRVGLEDKVADESHADTDGATVFTFFEAGLTGKINEDYHGFAYKNNTLEVKLVDIFSADVYNDTTLTLHDYYTATLVVGADAEAANAIQYANLYAGEDMMYHLEWVTLEAGTYNGVFMMDEMLGDYLLVFNVGDELVSVNFDIFTSNELEGSFFGMRGTEAGTYYSNLDEESGEPYGDLIILDGYGGIYRESMSLEWEGEYYKVDDNLYYAELQDTIGWFDVNTCVFRQKADGFLGTNIDQDWFFYLFEYGYISKFGLFETDADNSELLVDGFDGAVYTQTDGTVLKGTLTYEEDELITYAHFTSGNTNLDLRLNYNDYTFEVFEGTLKGIYMLVTEDTDVLGALIMYSDGVVDMYAVQVDWITGDESLVYAYSGSSENLGDDMYALYYATYGDGAAQASLGMVYGIDNEEALFVGYVLKGTFNLKNGSAQLTLDSKSATYKDDKGQSHVGTYTIEIANDADETIAVLFDSDDLHVAFVMDVENQQFTQRIFVTYEAADANDFNEAKWLIDVYDDGSTIKWYEAEWDDFEYEYTKGALVGEGTYKVSDTEDGVIEVYKGETLTFKFMYNTTFMESKFIVLESDAMKKIAGEYTDKDDEYTLTLDGFANAFYSDGFDDYAGYYFINEDGTYVFMASDGFDSVEFEFTLEGKNFVIVEDSEPDYDKGFHFTMYGQEWLLLETEGDDPFATYADIYQANYNDVDGGYEYTLAAHGIYEYDEDLDLCVYVVTEIVDDFIFDEDFTGFNFRFTGSNHIEVVAEEESSVTYPVTDGGELVLDGNGGATYTDADGEVLDGDYYIDGETIEFYWLNDEQEFITIYFTINDDGTVTLAEEPEPEFGPEAGGYQIVNMYAGWGYWYMELDGQGNVFIFTDYYNDDPDAIGTYTFDVANSHGAVTITERLTEAGEDVKDFKFVLVTVGYNRTGYIEADEELIDAQFVGYGWSVLTLDGYLQATYTNRYGYSYTGNYAEWDGFVYFYPGSGVEWIFSIDLDNGTFEQVFGVYYLNDINGNTKFVIAANGEDAYLQIGEDKFLGTIIEATFGSDGTVQGIFKSEDGAHDFDFSADSDTGLFAKEYDIVGEYLFVDESGEELGYTFEFDTGYNGGDFVVYDDNGDAIASGTYKLTDKENGLWTITFVEVYGDSFSLPQLGIASVAVGEKFVVYVEHDVEGDLLVFYNDEDAGNSADSDLAAASWLYDEDYAA